jgi:hypothetical protein
MQQQPKNRGYSGQKGGRGEERGRSHPVLGIVSKYSILKGEVNQPTKLYFPPSQFLALLGILIKKGL